MDTNPSRPRTSRIGGLEQLGKYELVCVLARSDLGSLWASVITYGDGVGQLKAVQRIVVRPGDEDALVEPIREATEALKGISRPGIVPVVDCVVSPGRLGVVSDYVEGEPLRSLLNLASLKKSPIPVGVAIRLGLDILEALVSFHGLAAEDETKSKYVYGGVSPDTVVVTAQGKAQLLNPGLTSVAASLPVLSWHTAALAYRSPEHLGSGNPVDARTDVFVTGVMLWELIAQRQLFQTRSPSRPSEPPKSGKRGEQVAIAQLVLTSPIDRLDSLTLPTAVPKAIADVVDKALQRDPAARWGSAREMAEALALAAKDLAASTEQVAEVVNALASSTLATRRSAIARAGVEVSGESKPISPVGKASDEDVFGSDWVVDADNGVDEKIHALGAGALAMTPTPSAAIAVSPKPAPSKPSASSPKAPSALRTPTAGIVRPKPKADAALIKQATSPVAPKAASPDGKKPEPSPVPVVPAEPTIQEDDGFDVELADTEAESDAGKRPPPPPVAAKPDTPTKEQEGPAPKAESAPPPDVPPPPAGLMDSANAFMAGGGDDAFAAPAPAEAKQEQASPPAEQQAPAEPLWSAPEAGAPEPSEPATAHEAAEPPPRDEEGSLSDEELDEQLAAAAQRRRKGYIALGIAGALVVIVGIGALIHAASGGSSSAAAPEQTATSAPTAEPAPTPTEATAPATSVAEPAAPPSAEPSAPPSALPPPAEPVATAAETATQPPAASPAPPKPTGAKPLPPRTGGPTKPKQPKPYVPSGI